MPLERIHVVSVKIVQVMPPNRRYDFRLVEDVVNTSRPFVEICELIQDLETQLRSFVGYSVASNTKEMASI
jgi:hypothetical protein